MLDADLLVPRIPPLVPRARACPALPVTVADMERQLIPGRPRHLAFTADC